MKNLLLLFLVGSLLASCSKKDDQAPTPDPTVFDGNNLEDYYIYSKYKSSGYIIKVLLDFLPDNKVVWRTINAESTNTYTLNEDKTTIKIGSIIINIQDGKTTGITQEGRIYSDFTFMRKPRSTARFAGKTFTGSYLRSNGTTLHQNFFYRFIGGNKVEVGANAGTSTQRTETYRPIGNIGALVESISGTNGHRELLLLINGKLEVHYNDKNIEPEDYHYGTFEEKK